MKLHEHIFLKKFSHRWFAFGLLVVLLVMLRVPSLSEPLYHRDEAMHFFVGDGHRMGLHMYTDVFDNKPPLLYLLASVTQSLPSFKFLTLLLSIAGLLGFFVLAFELFHKRLLPTTLATLTFLLLTTLPYFEGNTINGELYVVNLSVIGLSFLWSVRQHLIPWRLFGAGVFFGLAMMAKMPGVLEFLFALVFILVGVRSSGFKWRALGYVLAGVVVSVGLGLLMAGVHRDIPSFIDAVLRHNLTYTQVTLLQQQWAYSVFGWPMKICLGILLGLVLWRSRKKLSTEFVFVLGLFYAEFLATTLSFRPYTHYFMLLAPSLGLLLGFVLAVRKPLVVGLSLTCLALSQLVWTGFDFQGYRSVAYYQNYWEYVSRQKSRAEYELWFDGSWARHVVVVDWLRSNYKPGTPVFLYNDDPMVYHLAKMQPAVRYGVAYHVFDRNEWESTLEQVKTKRVCVVVVDDAVPEFDALEELVQREYRLKQRVDTARIYEHELGCQPAMRL